MYLLKYSFLLFSKVALMYSPDDIVGFACAFYGCLFAGVVPVPIHPPIQKDVSYSLTFMPSINFF